MNILACQFDIAWEDKTTNFAKVDLMLRNHPPSPDTLVVLPEMFATGFSTDTSRTRQGEPPECEAYLAGLARRYGVTVLGGVVGRTASGRCCNQSVVYDPTGRELARYTKIQPFSGGGELQIHEPGTEVVTFAWGGFTVAPLICYDLRFPELFRAGVRRGADLFVVIASWPVMRDRHWQILLQARAIENQAYVVGVNRCGRDPLFYHSGRSAVVDPLGVILADAGEGDRVLRAVVEPSVVANWRRDFPAVRDMGWTDHR